MIKMNRTSSLMALTLIIGLFLTVPAEAQLGQFGKNNIRYNQLDQFYESYRFDVWHNLDIKDPPQMEYLRRVVENLENARDWMSGQKIYNHTIETRIPILLYKTHTDMESSNLVGGFMPEGVGAFVESERRRMVLKADFSRPLGRAIGVHELAHEFQFDIRSPNIIDQVINMTSQRPLWFYEGGAEFVAGLYEPHTRDDIRRRSQRIASSDKHTVPSWEALNRGLVDQYAMGTMVFEFLEEEFSIGVALQVEGLKQKAGLGELIYDLAKGKLGNPDINSEKFNQRVIQFWTKKYQLEAIKLPKPYDENENANSRSVTPHGHPYPMLSPVLSPDGTKIAAFTIHNYSVSLVMFDVSKEDVYISKKEREERSKKTHTKAEEKHAQSKTLRNLTPHLPPIPWEYLVVQGLETWPFNGFDVDWSPDGSTIAVFARINRDHTLVLLDVENGKVKEKIELPLDQAFSPSFSSDGKKVYFSAAKNTTRDIYAVNLDTKETINLTNDESFDTAPAVSPDGNKVVYIGSDGDFQHLFILDLATGDKKQLTFGRFNDSSPSWSDDGSTLIYTSDETNQVWNLHTLDLATRTVSQWTEFFGGTETPLFARGSLDTVYYVVFRDDDQYEGYIYPNYEIFEAKLKKPIRQYVMQNTGEAGKLIFNPTRDLFKFELDTNQILNPKKPPERWGCSGGGVDFGVSTYWGMFGQSYFRCSNLLETKHHLAQFALYGSFRVIDYSYVNQEKRTTWLWGAHHSQLPLYYQFYDIAKGTPRQPVLNQTWVKEYSLNLTTLYPLNKFNRFELYSKLRHHSFVSSEFDYDVIEAFSEYFSPNDIQLARLFKNSTGSDFVFGGAYVRDTVLYSGTTWGPFHGNAFRAQVEFAPPLSREFNGYTSVNMAARTYRHLGLSALFAGRVDLMATTRANGDFILMGGPDKLRGVEYGSIVGNQVGYASAELRFPVPGTYVLGMPIRGFLFSDAGYARFSNEMFPAQKLATYGFGAQYIIPFIGLPAQTVWTRDNGKWKATFYITFHW